MEIQDEGSPSDGGWIIDFTVKETGPCSRPPVYAGERVPRLGGADAGDSGWVFEQPMHEADVADRPARRNVVPLQWDDLGIDEQIIRQSADVITAVQAKKIAALHHQRADLKI